MAKPTILIVDEIPSNIQILGELLMQTGYEVLIATNGPDALVIAGSSAPPHLILLDVAMPEMDGYEVCRRLKAAAATRAIPVIFISAHHEPAHKIKGFSLGAVDYITKPYQAEEVVVRVGTHIQLTHEIEERKRSEAALRESEQALKNAQKVAHLGSWTWRIAQNQLEWSDEMYVIFGIPKSEFTGNLAQVVEQVIHPDDREAVRESNRLVIENNQPTPLEYRIVWPDGSVRYAWAKAGSLQFDAAGKPAVLTGIVQDITERKTAEASRIQLEHQLQQAQKLESIGRLAGGVAHDFNNMLVVIQGHAELAMLQMGPDHPLQPDMDAILRATRHSAQLTRQLLAFSRKQVVTPQVLDLNVQIDSMLKLLIRLIREDIELVWTPFPEIWPVCVDQAQIDQILANLCVNARDAIANVGRIEIKTENRTLGVAESAPLGLPQGDYAVIVVSDNGCGMTEKVKQQVFEPFFTTKLPGKGTGLGLATVFGATTQNHGGIEIQSQVGMGTTFAIHFPRHQAKPDLKIAITPVIQGGTETILLVEDDHGILEMTKTVLELHGYHVITAPDPEVAIDLIRHHGCDIHLLIADVVLPGMNGRNLVDRLCAQCPKLKHLFISGYTADIIGERGVASQGIHFLPKPYSIAQLTTKVRELLDLPQIPPEATPA